MTKKRIDVPIACTLDATDAGRQLEEWQQLQPLASVVVPVEGGVRMTLPGSLEGQIRDLAERESTCCAFLTIVVEPHDDADAVMLEITSPNPDAAPVIAALAGIESP